MCVRLGFPSGLLIDEDHGLCNAANSSQPTFDDGDEFFITFSVQPSNYATSIYKLHEHSSDKRSFLCQEEGIKSYNSHTLESLSEELFGRCLDMSFGL